jgi:tRNA pseudouridine13 synthase
VRIKSRPQDFRVRELLRAGYLEERGAFRVYQVTKRKLTTLEAARELAHAAGVPPADVGLAGLKDRQGVTTQFMSVRGGRPLRFKDPSLEVVTVGSARAGLTSRDSTGNAFEIVLRGVTAAERSDLDREAAGVRAHGLPNYFGEQRFGNLRHGQGWIAKELMLGRAENALRLYLAAPSESDHPRLRAFKRSLERYWGDWKRCRDVAGTFGSHHSVFEHLAREPQDFAGAFRYIKSELRLIHLYAWQSHIWNRAVARWLGDAVPRRERFLVPSLEGPLVFPRGAVPAPEAWRGRFALPGARLADVTDADQRRWLEAALEVEGLSPEQHVIEGVSGFALKGEERQLVVRPRELTLEDDPRDASRVRVTFSLPRGAYATLVLARLAPARAPEPPTLGPRTPREEPREERRDERTKIRTDVPRDERSDERSDERKDAPGDEPPRPRPPRGGKRRRDR